MPLSIAEHFDVIWIITTVVLGLCLSLIIYFLRIWKNSVDESIELIQIKLTDFDKDLLRHYVSKADCNRTEGSIKSAMDGFESKMEQLSEKVDKYHSQIMYEFGVRNGTKRRPE